MNDQREPFLSSEDVASLGRLPCVSDHEIALAQARQELFAFCTNLAEKHSATSLELLELLQHVSSFNLGIALRSEGRRAAREER